MFGNHQVKTVYDIKIPDESRNQDILLNSEKPTHKSRNENKTKKLEV